MARRTTSGYKPPEGSAWLKNRLADLAEQIREVRAAVNALKRILLRDTGWVTITPAAGWSTSNLQYRVKNGICYFRGEFWGGADGTVVFTLPTEARPTSRLSHLCPRIVSTSTSLVVSLNIQTSGIATAVLYSGGTILSNSPGYSVGTMQFPVE